MGKKKVIRKEVKVIRKSAITINMKKMKKNKIKKSNLKQIYHKI